MEKDYSDFWVFHIGRSAEKLKLMKEEMEEHIQGINKISDAQRLLKWHEEIDIILRNIAPS